MDLAAAALGSSAGLRVGMALLLLTVAANGWLPLGNLDADSFPAALSWLGSPWAVVGAAGFYALEFAAYRTPVLDNAADLIESFVAPVGGTVIAMAASAGADSALGAAFSVPLLAVGGAGLADLGIGGWFLGFLVGGLPALLLHLLLALVRGLLNLFTCCLGTLASFLEDLGAAAVFLLALAAPVAALLLAGGVAVFLAWKLYGSGRSLKWLWFRERMTDD